MKVFFLLFAFSFFTYAQNDIDYCYEVIYQKELTKNIDDLNQIKDKTVKSKIIRLSKSIKNLEYSLFFNNTKSHFSYIDKLHVESNEGNIRRAIGLAGGDGIYYRDKKSKLHQFEVTSNLLLIGHNLNQYKWTIFNEKKHILGKLCYKAIGSYSEKTKAFGEKNIKVIAWYTSEIPVPHGPSGYDGLPGLVLEVNMGKISFRAKSIKKSELNCNKIIKPRKGITMTISESLIYLDKLFKRMHN